MCSTCGCSEPHHHHHDHEHVHETEVSLAQNILSRNDLAAGQIRSFLDARHMLALNLVSSPGSGKTSLLERTLTDLSGTYPFCVIEGDQQTHHDADRIAATGVAVRQINTGQGCHLDAEHVLQALAGLNPPEHSVLMIENVGNLICPALFDLGEHFRVVIMSVTEGTDKALKYPDIFFSSQLCLINKIDLLPYVDFNVEKAKAYARQVNPQLEFIELSATRGDGMSRWYAWLNEKIRHLNPNLSVPQL